MLGVQEMKKRPQVLISGSLPAQKFRFKEDDFSVQISLENDSKFWWRFEKSDIGKPLIITDFMPGSQGDETMAAALFQVVSSRSERPLDVIFHDLTPQTMSAAEYRIALIHIAQTIRTWCEIASGELGCRLEKADLSDFRGKARYTVRFE